MTALVVGHSRDPESQDVLRVARDLARRLRACLHVVHGIDLGDYPIDPDAADWEEQGERRLVEERDQVQTALAGCPDGWTYSAARGDPVSLISAAAEENDALMIIVGTRGEGLGPSIERLLCGSVSHGLIRRQDRPVLVVRAPRVRDPKAGKANGTAKVNAINGSWRGHHQRHRTQNRLVNYFMRNPA
jgi:nucleotide-binding universal stress UspA family protein